MVTRLEIIDESGRVFVKRDLVGFEMQTQDGGRTVKIFIQNKDNKMK